MTWNRDYYWAKVIWPTDKNFVVKMVGKKKPEHDTPTFRSRRRICKKVEKKMSPKGMFEG